MWFFRQGQLGKRTAMRAFLGGKQEKHLCQTGEVRAVTIPLILF